MAHAGKLEKDNIWILWFPDWKPPVIIQSHYIQMILILISSFSPFHSQNLQIVAKVPCVYSVLFIFLSHLFQPTPIIRFWLFVQRTPLIPYPLLLGTSEYYPRVNRFSSPLRESHSFKFHLTALNWLVLHARLILFFPKMWTLGPSQLLSKIRLIDWPWSSRSFRYVRG